tara:strand:+ start:1680 stop:1874 length:195 start_codon:yes stop_codon:yes gene_type:complete
MSDTDKYEGLIDAEGYIDYDGIIILLSEVKRLRSIADDLYAYIVSDADISLKIIEEQMDWRDEE